MHQTITLFPIVLALVLADPIVQLPNGQIRGREERTSEGKNFFAFEGIPYAAPPIGNLRFKAPQPPNNWNGVLDTTRLDSTCFQKWIQSDAETEDCLYLVAYTPQLPDGTTKPNLPVMIFFYGGGFSDGNCQSYKPDLYVNNDVIFVSFNFRQSIFGFLSTQDTVIPGNMGLKDQHLAIKWVHENIEFLGGDPNRVTIFGESSGAGGVAYQLLNPNNNGLIQGAIMQSGSSLGPWSLQKNARDHAFGTAAYLDSRFQTNNNSQDLLDFLQQVNPHDLEDAVIRYNNEHVNDRTYEIFQGYIWSPVIEVKNPDAVLTKKMYGLLNAGNFVQVPTIVGINSEEYINLGDENGVRNLMHSYDDHLDWIAPVDMNIINGEALAQMGRDIRSIYTNGLLADNIGASFRFCSDNSLTRSGIKQAELMSKHAKTYFYQFSYDGELGHGNNHYDGAESVGHGEDLYYLLCFGMNCDISGYSDADKLTRQRLVKLWTDFAKFQNPTPEASDVLQGVIWPAVDTSNGDYQYLDIGVDLEVKNHPKEQTYGRWNQLYDSLDYKDFDTY